MADYALLPLLYALTLAALAPALRASKLSFAKQSMVAVMVLVLAGGAYVLTGNHEAIQTKQAFAKARHDDAALLERIRSYPDDMEATITLALNYRERGDIRNALPLLRKAVIASQGQPELLSLYGEALVLEAGGVVTKESLQSFDMALLQQPDQPQARFFKALFLVQNGKKPEAIPLLKAIQADLPPDHPLQSKIKRFLQP